MVPGGALVTSWSESVRYIAATKRGYHGGISPQEMVVPTSVLIPAEATEPEGWKPAPESTPPWWDRDGRPVVVSPAAVEPRKQPQGMLFDLRQDEGKRGKKTTVVDQPTAGGAWIETLFATDVFAAQKRLVPRGYPGDELLCRLLGSLDARGGKLTSPALARAMEYATVRLPGLLSVAQRLFNVDGYPVISIDAASDTVQLDKPTLLVQFGLSGTAGVNR